MDGSGTALFSASTVTVFEVQVGLPFAGSSVFSSSVLTRITNEFSSKQEARRIKQSSSASIMTLLKNKNNGGRHFR